ncbi:MAG: amidohydrolase family protein, partial [Anaerolinea sp.]|nr:amidohydrolase family protein [Anaerolinea sp.]
RGSAAVVGRADELGSLEPGYLADIILLDFNGLHHQPLHHIPASLVYNTEINDVRTVIVDGNVVMADRRLLTIDESAVLDAIRGRIARLSRRNPAERIQTYAP